MAILIGACLFMAITDMPQQHVQSVQFYTPLGSNATASNRTYAYDKSMLRYNLEDTTPPHDTFTALFYGYSAGLLAISGFESSSNFVEQQEAGVFPKTLRNMWAVVSVMNVSLAVLALCLLPVDDPMHRDHGLHDGFPANTISGQGESGALLALMGKVAAGSWLELWVIIDAALVLTGAVLTAFVGYTGVTTRMAMDRLMPEEMVVANSYFGTRHWIVASFWALTSFLVVFSNGSLEVMGGIYTLAFLCVMAFFALGNMLIKLYRPNQPTSDVRASWSTTITAFLFMVFGWVGNMLSRDKLAVVGFFAFGFIFIFIAQGMIKLPQLCDAFASLCDTVADTSCCCKEWFRSLGLRARETRHELESEPVIFFTKDSNPATLMEATSYLLENEHMRHIIFISCHPDGVKESRPVVYDILRREFPELCQIDYITAEEEFTPDFTRRVSIQYSIPKQRMYMAAFSDKFPFTYTELGGIRLIAAQTPFQFQSKPEPAAGARLVPNGNGNGNENGLTITKVRELEPSMAEAGSPDALLQSSAAPEGSTDHGTEFSTDGAADAEAKPPPVDITMV